jgi:hypothetical protein
MNQLSDFAKQVVPAICASIRMGADGCGWVRMKAQMKAQITRIFI